jgi:hypothetical protein
VHQVTVQRVDLVNDTTWVDVRFEQGHRSPVVAVLGTDRAPSAVSVDRRTAPVQR